MIISQLAVSPALRELFASAAVTFVSPAQADPDACAAVVLSAEDQSIARRFQDVDDLPRFIVDSDAPHFIRLRKDQVSEVVLAAAKRFEQGLLPPFVAAMIDYTDGDQTSFATPGHHGGEFFRRTRAGRPVRRRSHACAPPQSGARAAASRTFGRNRIGRRAAVSAGHFHHRRRGTLDGNRRRILYGSRTRDAGLARIRPRNPRRASTTPQRRLTGIIRVCI